MAAGHYARARPPLEQALRLSPAQAFAALNLVSAYVLDGEGARALAVARTIIPEASRLAALALAHHTAGEDDRSREALAALSKRHGARTPYNVAAVHAPGAGSATRRFPGSTAPLRSRTGS